MTPTTLVKAERADAEALPASDITDLVLAESNVFAVTVDSPAEQVITMLGTVDVLKDRMDEVKRSAKERTQEWVEANGTLHFGPFRWHMGDVTDEEHIDLPNCLKYLFDKSGRDWAKFARDFLVKDPVKHGSAKNAMEEDGCVDQFFKATTVTELKDNVTKTKRELKKLDTRYVR